MFGLIYRKLGTDPLLPKTFVYYPFVIGH